MNSRRIKTYLILLLVALIWGMAGAVIKYTLRGFPPLVFLSYRFFLSVLIGLPLIILFKRQIPHDKHLLGHTLFYGFLSSTLALGLLFWGIELTTAIDATLITAVGPITIAAAGAIFLKEHVTLRERIGIGLAFAGTTVTIMEPLMGSRGHPSLISGNLLVFISVIVTTLTVVYAKILMRKDVAPLFVTNVSFVVGFLTILPLTLFVYSPGQIIEIISHAKLSYHLGVVYMAFLSGILAYFLWHKATKSIEIGEVGLIDYLYPIFGTPLAVFWLKERVSFPFVIGAIIIAIGVIIAEVKIKKSNKKSLGQINYWAFLKKKSD